MSFDKTPEKNDEQKEQKPSPSLNPSLSQSLNIREIPTYHPPTSKQVDWREEFKKGDDMEDELPDTKALIEKLNVSTTQAKHP